MGEEKKGKGKKKKGGEKKQEEEQKVEVVIEKKEEDVKPAAAVKEEEKPKVEENKTEGGDDKKDSKESPPPPPPPPPPPEIVLRVFMHCEGCARKVRKCLKGFDGVVDVTTDCKTHRVVVTGEKADPLKVLDRLQKKTHRQVDLLSPIPPPPPPPVEEAEKPEEKEAPKAEVKKEEPKVITVVLKVHMHCEACSLEIKRRIERMKEVEEAIPDLKSSQVTVKGTFEPPKLVEYVYKRTGKHATLVKEDPPPPEKKENDDKGKAGKEEKKAGKEEKKGGNGDKEKKAEETKGEQKEAAPKSEDGKAATEEGGPATAEEGAKVVELKTNEFQYYPPRYAMEMHAYPPQIFSDENPNACSIM